MEQLDEKFYECTLAVEAHCSVQGLEERYEGDDDSTATSRCRPVSRVSNCASGSIASTCRSNRARHGEGVFLVLRPTRGIAAFRDYLPTRRSLTLDANNEERGSSRPQSASWVRAPA